MWFSVVCTLIDNDIRHHSGQNLLWTHSAAPPALKHVDGPARLHVRLLKFVNKLIIKHS